MEGIQIRPYRKEDEVDLVAQANNPRIAQTLRDSFPSPYTLQDARRWITFCLHENSEHFNWAITLHDRVIGGIGAAVCGQDIYRFNAEVGYWLGEDYWGRGIVVDALDQMTNWIFANTPVIRLYAGVFSFNTASMRVLVKAGYHLEAIHKQAIFKKNQFWDEHYFVKIKPQTTVRR